jgi:hypothetical protein
MSKDNRRVIGEIKGVPIVEPRPDDHTFSHNLDGDLPGEERIACTCGWTSVSAPPELLDLDVHFAEVNGISYEEQKQRTAKTMRQLGSTWPNPKPTN